MGYWEEIEGEASTQVSQRSCGCPNPEVWPRSVQGQVGWLEQLGLVEGTRWSRSCLPLPAIPGRNHSGDSRTTPERGWHPRSWEPSRPGGAGSAQGPARPRPGGGTAGRGTTGDRSIASPLPSHGRICPGKVSRTSPEHRREPGEAERWPRGERVGARRGAEKGAESGERKAAFPGSCWERGAAFGWNCVPGPRQVRRGRALPESRRPHRSALRGAGRARGRGTERARTALERGQRAPAPAPYGSLRGPLRPVLSPVPTPPCCHLR